MMDPARRRGFAGLVIAGGAGLWILEKILVFTWPLAANQRSFLSMGATLAATWACAGSGSLLLAIGLLVFERSALDLWAPGPHGRPSSAVAVTRNTGWIATASFLILAVLQFTIARESSASPTLVGVGIVGSWMLSAIFLALGCFAYETFVRKLTRRTASLDFPRAVGMRGYSLINVFGIFFLSGTVVSGAIFGSDLAVAIVYLLIVIVIPILGIVVSFFLVQDGVRFRTIGRVQGVADAISFLDATARSRPRGSNATSWSCHLAERPNVVHQRVQARLVSKGFRITANVAPHGLTAKSRPFNLVILIVWIVLFWPGAVLYYLTRKRNSATVGIQDTGTGSYVAVDVEGAQATDVLRLAIASLTLAPSPIGASSTPLPPPDPEANLKGQPG